MYKEVVSFIFRILNFSIFIYLVIYIFRKYLLKTLRLKINNKKTYLLQVDKVYKDLIIKSDLIDREIFDQKLLTKNLESKILQWKDAFDRQKKQEETDEEEIQKEINNRVQIKQKIINLKFALNEFLPKIVQDTRKKLEQEFQDERKVIDYQNKLIESMKVANDQ